MFEIIDWEFNWEKNEIILCCKFIESGKHFYIHHIIESAAEADEIVSMWEIHCTMFFDPEMQHPN